MATPELQPLPYHRAVVDHLRGRCPAAWRHFGTESVGAAQGESVRLELLKSTYALERAGHPAAYAVADEVAERLSLGVPVALYQGTDSGMNAALVYLPEVASVVFQGPVLDRLEGAELTALFAHELAHHRLWRMEDGAYLRAAQVVHGLAQAGGQRSVVPTARLYQLSTELCADRAALLVTGDLDAAIRCLVKVSTGIQKVVASDFVAQAEKVWAAAGDGSAGWSHPEAHVRALALAWFAVDGEGAEGRIRALVEGRIGVDELDLLRREELAAWTRRLVDLLLQPTWFRSDAVVGHARTLFDDYAVAELAEPLPALRGALAPYAASVLDYVCFVLIDFAAVDGSLGEAALARAHLVAEGLGLADRFEVEVNRKLKLTKKLIRELVGRRDDVLARAAAQVEA